LVRIRPACHRRFNACNKLEALSFSGFQ
jgi:hypothetical protein